MSWLILFAHAFNPLLLRIGMVPAQTGKQAETKSEERFSIVLSSFFMYLLWLGAHFLVLSVAGAGFNYADFIGSTKGFAYFLPFILGFFMLIIEFVIRPRLRTETGQDLAGGLGGILFLSGCYFMFVNYLAWIAE